MLRAIGGVLAGIVIAFGVIVVFQLVVQAIYPPPRGANMDDPATVARLAAMTPIGARLTVILSWTLGSFLGAWLAGRIGKRAVPAVTPGVLVAAAAVANMFQTPHPVWFWIVSLALVAIATITGAALGAKKPAPQLVR
ncbi:MAG: hypothetical protein JOZ54_10155 [Acidobacteria bacterium]|nr:hypothetical protein [Acidobacteriota bacterium]